MMAAINDTTRKMITTAVKGTTQAYRDGWDRIFSKKAELPTAREQVCLCSACELARENIKHWRKLRGRS